MEVQHTHTQLVYLYLCLCLGYKCIDVAVSVPVPISPSCQALHAMLVYCLQHHPEYDRNQNQQLSTIPPVRYFPHVLYCLGPRIKPEPVAAQMVQVQTADCSSASCQRWIAPGNFSKSTLPREMADDLTRRRATLR